MAKAKNIYTMRNTYTDRAKNENDAFSDLAVNIQNIDTAILLLSSNEESVLIAVFKHITEFSRKQDENIMEIREKKLLEILIEKNFFIENENVIVKRFALYLVTTIIESMNTLQDLDTSKTLTIMEISLQFYLMEIDNFCIEYLSVIINKCFDDPQVAKGISRDEEFCQRLFALTSSSENPDILLNSLETIYKVLQVLPINEVDAFTGNTLFPIDRVLCELTNEFPEIRHATLKVLKTLVPSTSDLSPIARPNRPVDMLQQLTDMFCNLSMLDNTEEVIDVLALAMRNDQLAQLFFEQNLFEKIVNYIDANGDLYPLTIKCRVLSVFAETAKYVQFLYRLHIANVTEMFLECLLQNEFEVSAHVMMGLNRIMKFAESANRIVNAFSLGVVAKILSVMFNKEMRIRTREQAAEFLGSLLLYAFHDTASEMMRLDVANIFSTIFAQGLPQLSIDFILSLLSIIENLAQNSDYRSKLAESKHLTKNIALLLKESFSAAIIVSNIFRCLCTLIDEENVRDSLLTTYIAASIKRGLRSLANLVKTSVTNFIMQTTRFPEFVSEYIETGVLEVLILHQKHAFCVSTWNPAIESILSKCPTLKFCIRNHLGFTDTTVGQEFMVSKKKFEDFRIFQNILHEEVSPLHPIYVVNFDRSITPSEMIVKIPAECLSQCEIVNVSGEGWCYCRQPGDADLPTYLISLNRDLENKGLVENPSKVQRAIDFDNIAKRAKVVADIVVEALSANLKGLDLNSSEECSDHIVKCHLADLRSGLHCNFVPLGMMRSGCQFERAILFKVLADQIGLPCTLQRSVDGRCLFNEVPIPIKQEYDIHCDMSTMKVMPWRMLRPTHIVDLMYNVGELYPLQSRQALQYLRLY